MKRLDNAELSQDVLGARIKLNAERGENDNDSMGWKYSGFG